MKKGIVFTMDAMFAFYISLVFLSTVMVLMENSGNFSGNSLYLERLSRDIYEVQKYNPSVTLPAFVSTDTAFCDYADSVGSALIVNYGDIHAVGEWSTKSNITLSTVEVCMNG